MRSRPDTGVTASLLLVVLAAGCAESARAPWHSMAWQPAGLEQSKGVGVLAFQSDVESDGPPGAGLDTLWIAEDTVSAQPVARLRRADGTYWLDTPEGLAPRLVEYGYEIAGLVAERRPQGGWIRVRWGQDSLGDRLGWIQATTRVRFLAWDSVLMDHPVFFSGPEATFRAAPAGPTTSLPLATRDGTPDYIMYPLRRDGMWMQVRLVSPSDYCSDLAPMARQDTVWIQAFTSTGTPRVWYHTRGC